MSRLSALLVAAGLAAGTVGCAQCDTCDDFPAPCVGPNCGVGGAYGGSAPASYTPSQMNPAAPAAPAVTDSAIPPAPVIDPPSDAKPSDAKPSDTKPSDSSPPKPTELSRPGN